MKKANLNGVRPVIRKHQIVGRFITLGWLLALPAMAIAYILYVGCKEVVPETVEAAGKMLGVVFLPWGEDE